MPSLAPQALNLPLSGIRAITEMAWGIPDAIHLSVGEPQFEVAEHVRRAGADAWLRDDTNYTENAGIPQLREAIAHRLQTFNGLDIGPERVIVCEGGSQGMNLALSVLLSAGDDILIPDPGYTIFSMIPDLLQVNSLRYGLTEATGFLPDIDELERLVTPRTKAIIVNSPSNPLGSVFPPATVEALVEFARRHDLWLISDECYEAFVYGGEYVAPAHFDTDERVVSLYSLSKTYGLTGGRIGYLVVPAALAPRIAALQECSVSCVNTPAQWAAVAALEGPQDYVTHAASFYAEAADEASAYLQQQGFRFLRPTGAFYLWVNVEHVSDGDVFAWAKRFLTEEHVAIAPGSTFGPTGEGWIRICLAGDRSKLLEGLSRLPRP